MAVFNKLNCFTEDLAEKIHNLASDTLKIALTNTAPSATMALLADISEIEAGNGYAAGGLTTTQSAASQTGGTFKLVSSSPTLTATGAVNAFRYAVLYNSTPTANAQGTTGKPLIGWWDYGSSVSLAATETFTVSLDGTNGVIQIS